LKRHGRPFHLVLADVIMPGMNGKSLFEMVAGVCPLAKVVYLSSYPRDALSEHGILAQDVACLQKPFSGKVLTSKVCEVLDRA